MADRVLVINIFDQKYHIKLGENDPEYITKLANVVDERMRKYSQMFPELDPARLAILTCLNITDELLKSSSTDDDKVRLEELRELLKTPVSSSSNQLLNQSLTSNDSFDDTELSNFSQPVPKNTEKIDQSELFDDSIYRKL